MYHLQALLGAGGMGEVYRAHDSRLGRDVAIKILPQAFTADPDRLARFEREARVLASLNHPNIAAIYGVEDEPAEAGPHVHALILELVEGETLADRLRRGPVPVGEALTLARQIADALDAAHEKGIVHRDLKPANIKVTPEGVVKVLDFGLAKAPAGDNSSPDLTHSPTITVAGTREGVILGTAAYMSPEQARGKPVDARSDVWAFGCVLYEMLTGRAAFGGHTVSDTIAKIIEREPDWAALPPAVSPGVARLLTRCLDKDLRRRLQHIGEARIEIEDVLSGATRTPPGGAVVDLPRPRIRLVRSIAVVTSLVALIAVGGLMWTLRTVRQVPTAPARLVRLTMATSGTAAVTGNRPLTMTPDGSRVVYIGNNETQVFVRPLDGLDATAIATGAAPLNSVFISPDGQWVGFVEGTTLKKVAITGGPATTIAQRAATPTWASDDAIILASTDAAIGLQRVSAADGAATVLTRPDPSRGEVDHALPEMLPGGRAVLFTILATTGGLEAAQVAVLDLVTGESRVLVRGGSHGHYVPSGHLVYVAGGTLRAVPFDVVRLETHGAPVTVLPRLVTTAGGAGFFAVATDGTLTYMDAPSPTAGADRTLVWVDRQGREEPLAAPPRAYIQPRVSPDGTRVAVVVQGEGSDIWLWDLARQTLSRRTFDPAADFFPVWTPDGRRLVYNSARGSGPTLFWQPADGTGAAEALGNGFPSGMTPDGTRVLLSIGGRDQLVLAVDGARSVQPLVQTPFNERNGVVSPDGGWLAYESDSSGRFEIYVRPFPNVSAGQWLVSTAGGARARWASSGEELFYEGPGGAIMAVRVDPGGGTWSAGSPTKVIEGPYLTLGGSVRNYDVSPDGRRFLMVKPSPAFAPQIIVVQNWSQELTRLVPVN